MLSFKKLSAFDLAALLLSALIYLGIAKAPFKAKPFGDMDFHSETKVLADFLWGRSSFNNISISKAPGPVLFYTIPYCLAGPGASDDLYWLAGVIWTGIFMTISLFLLKSACSNLGNELAGKVVVVLMFILPLHLYYGLGILAEGMAFIACTLLIYGWSLFMGSHRRRSGFVWYAIGMTGLILARPNAGLIILFAGVYYFWRSFLSQSDDKIFAKKMLITLTIVAVGLILVFFVVKNLPGEKSSSQEKYLLHVAQHGRFQFREEIWDWRFWDNNTRGDSKDYQNQIATARYLDSLVQRGESYEKVYTQWIVEDVLLNPQTAVKQFFIRVLNGHTLTINSVNPASFKLGPIKGSKAYYFVMGFLNVLNWSIIILCVIYFIKYRESNEYFAVLVVWFSLVIFSAMLYMEQRYIFPARAVILFFAAFSLSNLLKHLKFRFSKNA